MSLIDLVFLFLGVVILATSISSVFWLTVGDFLWTNPWVWTRGKPSGVSQIRFKLAFGFWPGEASGWLILMDKYQIVVDQLLSDKSAAFLLHCGEEEALRQKARDLLVSKDILGDTRRLSGQIERAESRVERSKRNFWSAHKLAHDFGFSVRRKAKDYVGWGNLIEPLREEGQR